MIQTELQQLFAEIGLTPSRKLGQNFLADRNVASWITRQLQVEPGDTVVEVGPGAGALTRELLERTENLVLVEMDGRLAEFLRRKMGHRETVRIHQIDACQFDVRQLYPCQPVKLIGNLPYSAGGEIIRNFLGIHSPVCEAVLMLQREVAERIASAPGTKAYGILSLRIQARWEVEILKHVPPECFYPRPQVESTVIRLTPRPAESLPPFDHRLLDATIRRGFSQRRKQLRKCLGLEPERWSSIAAELGLSESVRAEQVPLEAWVALTHLLDDHPLKDLPQRAEEPFDVVNEANEVIDRQPRGVVHRDGLLHRAVHLFVFNRKGDLFLQKRSRLKDVHPGAWDSSAAGHLDPGEAYEDAAQRELGEELGFSAPVTRAASIPPSEANGREFIELYRVDLPEGCKPHWPASEIEFGQFFPVPLVREWIERRPEDFAGGFLECWAAFEKAPGSALVEPNP